MDFFKRLFDIPHRKEFNDDDRSSHQNMPQQPPEMFTRRGFDIFTDPLQMHQYFEHQMQEILKSFGFQGFSGSFDEFPILPEIEEKSTDSRNLRDQFLKPGYDQPAQRNSDRVDKDLDEKLKFGDLDSIFDRSENDSRQLRPFWKQEPSSFFFGKSQTFKTITNPDGSIDTHQSIRDNEGNEEITTCHKFGDKEYCVIKKRDREGKEEVTERLVNMDEKEKDSFLKQHSRTPIGNSSQNRFYFDIFFK